MCQVLENIVSRKRAKQLQRRSSGWLSHKTVNAKEIFWNAYCFATDQSDARWNCKIWPANRSRDQSRLDTKQHGGCFSSTRNIQYSLWISVKNNVCELEPWEWFIRFKLLWTNQISPCISEEVTHRNCAWSSGKFYLCLNWRVIFCKSFNCIWKVCCISGFVHFCILVCGYNSWEEHLFCCFSAD